MAYPDVMAEIFAWLLDQDSVCWFIFFFDFTKLLQLQSGLFVFGFQLQDSLVVTDRLLNTFQLRSAKREEIKWINLNANWRFTRKLQSVSNDEICFSYSLFTIQNVHEKILGAKANLCIWGSSFLAKKKADNLGQKEEKLGKKYNEV